MSSKKYASPLWLELKPSRSLFILLVGLHACAIILVFTLELDLTVTLLVNLFILFLGFLTVHNHALRRSSSAIIRLNWDDNNEWQLESPIGVETTAQLMGDSYISPRLTILIFKKQHRFGYQSVILLRDNIDENDFRRLRVRLRVGKPIEV